MIVAVTGHRPDKLGGYGDRVRAGLFHLAVTWMSEARPDKVISGMALGWDQAVARAAIKLRVPFVAAVPCDDQESRWPPSSQEAYRDMLKCAAEVYNVSSGPYAWWKMQARNEWMIDHCEQVVALWNGSLGGTYNCIEYARRVGRPVVNLWDRWQ